MNRFRILHISDLHIAWWLRSLRQSRYNPTILEKLAKLAYDNRSNLDALLVSGDLSDSGRNDDLVQAWDFIYSSPGPQPTPWLNTKKQPTLQAVNKPIFIMPGNHDRYRSWPKGTPGGVEFDKIFKEWQGSKSEGIHAYALKKENSYKPDLLLLCADFTLTQSDSPSCIGGKWGQGVVDEIRLQRLVAETKKSQPSKYNLVIGELEKAQFHNQDIAVVWIVHFAPEFEKHYPLKEYLQLLNSSRLIEEARKLEIRHIFCGHTHLRRIYPEDPASDFHVHCAATACCQSSKIDTAIHSVDIYIDKGDVSKVVDVDIEWDQKNRRFKKPVTTTT